VIEVLRWGIRKLGGRTISCWILLLSALSSVALGMSSIVRGLDAELVLTVTALGILMGWVLAQSRLPGWLAGILAVALGVAVVFLRVGQLGGKLILLLRAWAELAWQIGSWQRSHPWPDAQPALQALTQLANDGATLAARWYGWLATLANGTPAFDPVAVALTWSFMLWLIAVWAAWAVRRRERPFEALIPGTALLGGMLAYVGGNPLFLLPPLGALLLLMVLLSESTRERLWNLSGIDFAEEIRFDLAVVSVPLSFLLLVTAAVAPSISVTQIARYVQRSFTQPGGGASSLSDSLGLIPQSKPESVFDPVISPGLPRRHLIGAGPELSRQLVMTVRIDDPSTNGSPRYYWRSTTYERYTGRGWLTDVNETVGYRAGEQTVNEAFPTQRLVYQEVQMQDNAGALLLAAGTLVTVDRDFQVAWRSHPDGDLFGANVQARTYRVASLVSVAGEAELRSAGSNYPNWIRARYLDLPDGVPDRVLALARDLTATAPTPYDRARAIESYLRQFPYTLDVRAPPLDRDVADYFLFDLRRGYCDYYATAMVVLARAAGLPARLVVGYAMGTYDPSQARYVVTEADAHSWVEVYFPGYGWIEFEPTGGRAPFDFSAAARPPQRNGSTTESSTTPAARLEPSENWWFAMPGGLVLLGLALVLWLTLDGWRLRRLAPEAAIDRIYLRLSHHSRRLGLPARSSDTPDESARQWEERLARWAEERREGAAWQEAEQDIRWLTGVYVQRRYSPRRPDPAVQEQAVRMWERLRLRLWRAWVEQSCRRLVKRKPLR